MKHTRSLVNSLVVCGVAVAMGSTILAQPSGEEVARVTRVHGTARYMPPGGTFRYLTAGTILKPGSVVQTGIESGSYVDIVLGKGRGVTMSSASGDYRKPGAVAASTHFKAATSQTAVRVFENTVLGIDKLSITETGAEPVTDTELDLRKGHIIGNVKKLTAGSEFRVRYPKGVAGIRGSVFDMTVEERQQLAQGVAAGTVTLHVTFSMSEGTAVISFVDANGNTITQTVEAMKSWNSDTPTVVGSIPPAVYDLIRDVLRSLNIAPEIIQRIIATDQTVIEQVTTTAGMAEGESSGPGAGR